LSFSLFFSPRSPDIMMRLADKNIDIDADSSRHVAYFLLRYVPSIIIYSLFFLVFLHSSYSSSTLFSIFYWQSPYSGGSLADDVVYRDTVLAVQVYSQCVFVLALIVHSMSFLHRYDSLHRLSQLGNRVCGCGGFIADVCECFGLLRVLAGLMAGYRTWSCVAICCFAAQILFAMVSVLVVDKPGVLVSGWLYLWFVWPVWIIVVDECIKMHDRKRREFYHNRARSHFDTVLGMHSPL